MPTVIPDPPEKVTRSALRVLDALDRGEARLEDVYNKQRTHARKAFRGLVTVSLSCDAEGQPIPEHTFRAWARNVSQSGVSFVDLRPIKDPQILVGLGQPESLTWFQGEVVRARRVQDEFWEYGVKFVARMQPAAPAAPEKPGWKRRTQPVQPATGSQ